MIKELYGTASKCAFPNCAEPLYRELPGGGRALNSRVSHIVARSEEGPRWRDDQSEAENRSFGNLLLLCIPHASEVDDPKQLHRFGEDTLKAWKAAQIEIGKGYSLSDAEVKTVEELSFRQPINVSGQTLHFGGQGGQAPGAAGGGGAAIGYGAVGGPGGSVGAPTRFFLRGLGTPAPGAGGGGGGAIALERIDWASPPPGRDTPHFPSNAPLQESDVRVTSLFLADTVRTPNGLLYVFGGNPSTFTFRSLPQIHSVVLVCAVHMSGLPEGLTVKLAATVYNPAGDGVATQEFAVESGTPESVSLLHRAFDFQFEVSHEGAWRLAILEGGRCLAWIPFEVRIHR